MTDGYGYGDGYGSGHGYGYGYGTEYDNNLRATFVAEIAPIMDCKRALSIENVELRRELLSAIEHERLCSELDMTLIAEDLDWQGNQRLLLELPLDDAMGGAIHVVRVQCPTTGRIYHHLVPNIVKTCQEAHDWMFRTENYQPVRES